MTNVFENAYFGKLYKTRDNKKAILLYYHLDNNNIIDNAVLLIIENATQILVDGNGKDLNEPYHDSYHDIVSEWQDSIDEEKLDELAKEYINNSDFNNDTEEYHRMSWIEKDAFKAGYRIAKQE